MRFNILNLLNHQGIGILYIIFGVFAGLIGTSFSMLIRIELEAPGNQIFNRKNDIYKVIVTAHVFLILIYLDLTYFSILFRDYYYLNDEILSQSKPDIITPYTLKMATGLAAATTSVYIASKVIQSMPNSSWGAKTGIMVGSAIPLSVMLGIQANNLQPVVKTNSGNIFYRKIVEAPMDPKVQNYLDLSKHQITNSEILREQLILDKINSQVLITEKKMAEQFISKLSGEDLIKFNHEYSEYLINSAYNYSIRNAWFWRYKKAENPLLDPKWKDHPAYKLNDVPQNISGHDYDYVPEHMDFLSNSTYIYKEGNLNYCINYLDSYNFVYDEDYMLQKTINDSWDYIPIVNNISESKLHSVRNSLTPDLEIPVEISTKTYDFFDFLVWWMNNYNPQSVDQDQILNIIFLLILILTSSLIINFFFLWQNISIGLKNINFEFSNKILNFYYKRLKNFPLPYWYCIIISFFNLYGLIIWRNDLYDSLMYLFKLFLEIGIISIN